MSDPHTLRHPLPATIHHLLDRLSGLHREEPTPPVNGPRNPIHPLSPTPLTPHQHEVLQAVAEQRIHRDILLGTLEPHLLDGQDVTWTLRALVLGGSSNSNPSDHHASPPADAGHSAPRTDENCSAGGDLDARRHDEGSARTVVLISGSGFAHTSSYTCSTTARPTG